MQVPQSNFDPESVALMGRVCDEVWRQAQATFFFSTPSQSDQFLHQMATRVMAAVALGERDPQRLRVIARDGMDG